MALEACAGVPVRRNSSRVRFEFLERVTRCLTRMMVRLSMGGSTVTLRQGSWYSTNGDLLLFEQRVNLIVNSVDHMFPYIVEREFSSGIKINESMALSNCLK